jgi:hypothetical protein
LNSRPLCGPRLDVAVDVLTMAGDDRFALAAQPRQSKQGSGDRWVRSSAYSRHSVPITSLSSIVKPGRLERRLDLTRPEGYLGSFSGFSSHCVAHPVSRTTLAVSHLRDRCGTRS